MDSTSQSRDPFLCQCGCGKDVMQSLRVAFEKLERRLGRKLTITSGARCASHNESIKNAAKASLHMAGIALDIATTKDDQDEIAKMAKAVGFRGIGKGYGGLFVHIDLGYIREWEYDKDGRPIYAARH